MENKVTPATGTTNVKAVGFNSGLDHNNDLVELMAFLFAGQKFVQDATADDGKITLADYPKAIPALLLSTTALTGLSEIFGEWKSSTPQEKDEVFGYFNENFKLKNSATEALIEDGIHLARLNVEFFAKIAKARQTT